VFLVWAAGPATVSAVVARLARSVQRVVFLSSPHQTPHPFFRQPNPMAALHASIEDELATSGVPSVILRPGMFAANTLHWWAPQIRAGDVVRWPYGAVETAPIDERDIAAVAVRALSEASLAGGDYVLTGPAALSHARQVAVIGEVLGRRLAFHELSPDAFRRETAASWPPPVVDMLLAAWGAAVGHPAYVTTAVAELTGGPARSFHDWVVAHCSSPSNMPSFFYRTARRREIIGARWRDEMAIAVLVVDGGFCAGHSRLLARRRGSCLYRFDDELPLRLLDDGRGLLRRIRSVHRDLGRGPHGSTLLHHDDLRRGRQYQLRLRLRQRPCPRDRWRGRRLVQLLRLCDRDARGGARVGPFPAAPQLRRRSGRRIRPAELPCGNSRPSAHLLDRWRGRRPLTDDRLHRAAPVALAKDVAACRGGEQDLSTLHVERSSRRTSSALTRRPASRSPSDWRRASCKAARSASSSQSPGSRGKSSTSVPSGRSVGLQTCPGADSVRGEHAPLVPARSLHDWVGAHAESFR
jgi:uncharacterized protein YbjT (DUF2867 family)